MKNIAILIVAIISLIACGRNEDSINNVSGEWKLLSAKYLATNQTKDYSNQNIIYNFQNNGTLIVSGGANDAYSDGNYSFLFKNDYLSNFPTSTEPKIDLVVIQNNKWSFTSSNNLMTLDQSHVDGPLLTFIKK